jgi:hypothetical protein
MYYPFFVAYMVGGFVLSMIGLTWALRNGQLRDQERARYLPLEPVAGGRIKKSPFSRIEIYGLAALALAGLSASGAVLVFAIIRYVR